MQVNNHVADMNDQDLLNSALMSIPSRSEKNEQSVLVDTFVTAGTLFKRLSSVDNQIIYGRRGTGKTHTLQYLASQKNRDGNMATYTDLGSLGSAASVYSDASLPIPQRATTLLRDLMLAVHEEIRRTISRDPERLALHSCNQWLSELLDQINEVQVIGEIEISSQAEIRTKDSEKVAANIGSSDTKLSIGVSAEEIGEKEEKAASSMRKKGVASHHIKFGGVNSAIRSLANALPVSRMWILLDEWSSVPLELQPYLADVLRRCMCNVPKITLKIAALEYRSNFKLSLDNGGYVGLEVGAEMTSIVNVDDYLVFENDKEKARKFYMSLFAKHIRASGSLSKRLIELTDEKLTGMIFTQKNAFDELVMAAEGVPRDAINIASLAAQQADDRKLSIPHVKRAARQWYLNAKRTAVDNGLLSLLNWIVDEVIGQRKARAFLIATGAKSAQIDALFDARVLHVTKRDISQPDGSPSPARYDAFKLDYGCYVHLMTTRQDLDDAQEIEIDVPTDDYRSMRRAVLDLGRFDKRSLNINPAQACLPFNI